MSGQPDQNPLQFSARWLDLGLLTPARLQTLEAAFRTGEDPNPEHYRYRVFQDYLAARRPLPPETVLALYALAEEDPDPALRGALRHALVALPECPESVLNQAFASGERHLARLVVRRRLLAEVEAGLTPELFQRCLESGDSVIQRRLLEMPAISTEQLHRLAREGRNRAIRNLSARLVAKRNA